MNRSSIQKAPQRIGQEPLGRGKMAKETLREREQIQGICGFWAKFPDCQVFSQSLCYVLIVRFFATTPVYQVP